MEEHQFSSTLPGGLQFRDCSSLLLYEFEWTYNITSNNEVQEHHNSIIFAKWSFQKDLKLLLSPIDQVENPFSDDSYNLYTLGTKYVVPEDVLSSIFSNKQDRGEKKLNEFLKSRFWNKRITISDTVSKNGVQCLSTARNTINCSRLKTKVNLFSVIYFLSDKWRRFPIHF